MTGIQHSLAVVAGEGGTSYSFSFPPSTLPSSLPRHVTEALGSPWHVPSLGKVVSGRRIGLSRGREVLGAEEAWGQAPLSLLLAGTQPTWLVTYEVCMSNP